MAALDDITKEKQRLSEALARVDAQRERLAGQLSELEATERVLARYSKGVPTRRTGSRKASSTATATAPARSRGRQRGTAAKPNAGREDSPSLGDQILALANGRTQQEIAAACDGVRANHVGIGTTHAAAELAEARRLAGGERYSSIARLENAVPYEHPRIRALFKSVVLAGWRKAGVPEE